MGMAISHQRLRLISDLHQHPEIILVTVLTDSDALMVVSAAVLCAIESSAVIVHAAWRVATKVT